MKDQKNNFYSVKFDTKTGIEPLRYFQNFDDLKKYLDRLEMMFNVSCIIEDDLLPTLIFVWTKKDGSLLNGTYQNLPVYASMERFG